MIAREPRRHVSRQRARGRSSSSGWKVCRAKASASCKLSTKDAGDDRPPSRPAPRWRLTPRLAHRRHWPGMTQAALPARTRRLCGGARQRASRRGWPGGFMHRRPCPARKVPRRGPLRESTPRPRKGEGRRQSAYPGLHPVPGHPRLLWATGSLKSGKESRGRSSRCGSTGPPSEAPETFYIVFPFPCESALPQTSCGGVPFVPFRDQTARHLPRLLRHRRLDSLRHAGGPLVLGEPRRSAGELSAISRRCGRAERPSARHASGVGHDLRQFLVHQLRRRQSRRDGVPLRPGLAEELPASGWRSVARTLAAEPQVMINPGLKKTRSSSSGSTSRDGSLLRSVHGTVGGNHLHVRLPPGLEGDVS